MYVGLLNGVEFLLLEEQTEWFSLSVVWFCLIGTKGAVLLAWFFL